jgi:DNA-binding MarR family transcriptional regulator
VKHAATTLDALETMAFALVSLTSRALAEAGGQHLTFQQWRALVVLGSGVEPLRISELAKRIDASGPSTSRIAQRLLKQRLVAIEPDPRDRRAVQIQLTEYGAEVWARVVARRRELIKEMIGRRANRPVSPDDAALVAALSAAI